MNEEYDYIVLGTGMKECILSGMLSCDGKKVLHMDRNPYYGGESASLNLEQLYGKFKPEVEAKEIPEALGRSRDYNVDLCPKFLMSCGDLTKMLLHTKVTRYLEFRSVAGSYVYKDGKVHKVPSTAAEALSTGLMGFFQKRRFKNYLEYVQTHDSEDPKTWSVDPTTVTNQELFDKHSCDDNTIAFTGHAMALYPNDDYLSKPCGECIDRVRLYAYSVSRYGSSPYIYPMWGLGGIPEGFSRLGAIHGGVFMLNKPIDEILYNEDGTVRGVKSEGEEVYCKKLLADPSYMPQGSPKVRKTGRVARCISILNHPIEGTDNADSCQIIMPAKQIPGRNKDIYVAVVSHHHKVAAQGKWISIISLDVESPEGCELIDIKKELIPALKLVGTREVDFFWVTDTLESVDDGSADNVFVTSSYDASSHFQTATVEVMKLYEKMTGKQVDLTADTSPENLEDPQ